MVQSGHLEIVANEIILLLLAHDTGPVLDNRLESIRSQLRVALSLLELKCLLLRLKLQLLTLFLSAQVLALDIVVLGLRDEARVEGLLDLLQIAQGRHRVRVAFSRSRSTLSLVTAPFVPLFQLLDQVKAPTTEGNEDEVRVRQ